MTDAAKPSHRLLRLFSTPVIVDELGDSDLNTELEKVIVERMNTDPAFACRTSAGGSRSTIATWAGKAGERIVKHAAALATANTAAAPGSVNALVDRRLGERQRQRRSQPVAHPRRLVLVGGLLCPVGSGEGGELILHDPRMPALRMHAPNLRFNDVGPEVIVPIKPKSGLMILFPAWLSHSVQPWEGDRGFRSP